MNETLAPFYEFFHYSSSFSQDLYLEGVYSTLFLTSLAISLALVLIFYYVINRPKFGHWYYWGIVLLINAILTYIVGSELPWSKFETLGIGYESGEYVTFGLKNALISSFFFVTCTYLLKWKSSNLSGTPKLFIKF